MTILRFGDHAADMADMLWFGFSAFYSDAEPELLTATESLIVIRDPQTGLRQSLYGEFDFSTEESLLYSTVHRVVAEDGGGGLLFDWSGLHLLIAEVLFTQDPEAFAVDLLAGDDLILGSRFDDVLGGDVPRWHDLLNLTPTLYWQAQLDLSDDRRFLAGVVSHWVDLGGSGVWRDDVVLRDLATGAERWVSIAAGADPFAGAGFPSLSADGSRLAFQSADAALAGVPLQPFTVHAWVFDAATQSLLPISATAGGSLLERGGSLPVLSADGRLAVFESTSPEASTGAVDGITAVYLKDLASGELRLVSSAADGTPANGLSGSATLSADGRVVAFVSTATNLVPGVGGGIEGGWIYAKELATGAVQAVAPLAPAILVPDGQNEIERFRPALSADGRVIAFASFSSDLVPGDTNGQWDVFVMDLRSGEIRRVSETVSGGQLDQPSWSPELSADGGVVGFESLAPNLDDQAWGFAAFNRYLRDLDTGEIMRLRTDQPDASPQRWPQVVALAADAAAYAYIDWAAGEPQHLVVRAVGGTGYDTIVGGAGDDLYFGDLRDTLVELDGGGLDTVATALPRYVLPEGIEQLVYVGSGWFVEGRGNALDNLITGSIFGDTLFGEGGLDRTWYPGPRAEYAVRAATEGGFRVAHLPGREGTDRLHDFERIEFADAWVALDLDGAAGQAYRIYKAAFDRAPDVAGLGYWIAQLDAGEPLLNVATGFVGSAEFAALYGASPTDLEYIRALYLNVLDREPDPAGQAYWEAVLGGDPVLGQTSREQMLVDFSESDEDRVNVVGLIADGIDYLPWGA